MMSTLVALPEYRQTFIFFFFLFFGGGFVFLSPSCSSGTCKPLYSQMLSSGLRTRQG